MSMPLSDLPIEAGAYYIFDRGYIDFKRLFRFEQAKALFIIRGRKNLKFRRLYSKNVDKTTGIRSDQIGVLAGKDSAKKLPGKNPPDSICRSKHQNKAYILHQ